MLQLVPVPPQLVGRPYSMLVTAFVLQGQPAYSSSSGSSTEGRALGSVLPLGLLRRKSENRGWQLPYVAVHPGPDVVLESSDAVYVLRTRGCDEKVV